MNVWLSVFGGGVKEGTGTGEAYIVLSIQVGSFVQEHLRHFHMTIISGPMESSPIILSETDTHSERETPRDGLYHPPLTDTHAAGHGIYGHTDRHATAGCIVHRYMYVALLIL